MYVVLCDDEPVFLRRLTQSVSRGLECLGLQADLVSCRNGLAFEEAISVRCPELVFIDIALGEGSGFDLAASLRRLSLDTEIVFVTAYSEHMSHAFEYRAIGFLCKPVTDADVDGVLRRYLSYRGYEDAVYSVRTRDSVLRIPYRRILYFESRGHHIRLNADNCDECAVFRGKLDDIEREQAAYRFVRCHKSYLVNLRNVLQLDKGSRLFVLRGGGTVPISKSRYELASDQYMTYQF